jgi:hypothetical protein
VGTKFLSEALLREEANTGVYGTRVRDSHAEVLARRAFRRALTLEIRRDLQSKREDATETPSQNILRRVSNSDGRVRFALKQGVTLHMYTSSAPCGNATIKKFAKMQGERFINELGPDEWPTTTHGVCYRCQSQRNRRFHPIPANSASIFAI